MSRRHALMLLLLSTIWGASFLLIKEAGHGFEPIAGVMLRIVLAAAALGVVVRVRHRPSEVRDALRAHAGPIVLTGLLNTAIPFWLLFWAETRIDSGLAAVLQAAAPLFTVALGFAFFRSERVTGMRLAGFLLGFGGVLLLVGTLRGGSVLAGLAVIGTSVMYATAALVAGKRLAGVPPLITSAGSLATAALVTLPWGIVSLPAAVPGWKPVAAVVTLSLVGTAFAYLLYFELIAGAGGSRAILVTYLVPAIALFWGAALLDEPVTAEALGGLALILGGVALGTGAVRRLARR